MSLGKIADMRLEPINEKIRGAEVEELLTNGDEGLVLSFRGNVPDLFIDVDFDVFAGESEIDVRFGPTAET